MNRVQAIDKIKKEPKISVLIVGAGINGIGTFRDLALQGVDVLLVDKSDYCSGASAASSHMVHGGIRYLENGEFRLVREAVQERNRLIEVAPHLVKPLPTVFPIFKWFSGLLNAPLKFFGLLDKPSERGAVVIKIGMVLYDLYTKAQKTVPAHVFANRKESLAKFPRLNPEIIFTGTYYDGAMPSPERIAVEIIKDSIKLSDQAWAANYLRMDRTEGSRVYLVDELSGDQYYVQPDLLINAAGPWIDIANRALGIETQFIGGTKGSHLVLDAPEIRDAIKNHEFFFENKDGRIVLIFPLEDKVMIGTSDIRIENPGEARCTESEIDYFFELVSRVFPDITLDRSQIVFQFSGVRPLPFTPASSTGQISRDHKVEVIPPGSAVDFPIFSLVGGKWTSFRAFSEHTADQALDYLGRTRQQDTKEIAIGGGKDYPTGLAAQANFVDALADKYDLELEIVKMIFDRYGTVADEILAHADIDESPASWPIPGYWPGELAYLMQTEDIVHLDDLILRRCMIGKLGLLSPEGLGALAEVAAQVKSWTEAEKQREIQRTIDIFKDGHGIDLN
ncbi:MAG: glycerol-3-phosphate dehydrogenase/oxidase [Chloroflexota bacterium]